MHPMHNRVKEGNIYAHTSTEAQVIYVTSANRIRYPNPEDLLRHYFSLPCLITFSTLMSGT